MEKFKAVLFDFDGVIGKTMEDSCRAWETACAEAGLSFDREAFYLAEGMKAIEFARTVLLKHGRDLADAHALVSRKNELYRSNNSFAFYGGIEALMQRLRGSGVKVGVVSGGSRARLLSGEAGKLLRSCDAVITGDDLTQGKPAPEGYQKAAEALKVAPADCLVVENAPLGIESAKTAGMSCIGVCSTLARKHLEQADRVVADHDELTQVFCGTVPFAAVPA